MNVKKHKIRAKRVRMKIHGTAARPRLSVFRSNRFIYAQLIDDEKKRTIIGASEKELNKTSVGVKQERAKALGGLIAKKAQGKKIKSVVFDRGGYGFLGRVKSFAEGAREGGLEF